MRPVRLAVSAAAMLLLTAASVAAQTTIVLVRHAEKEAEPAADPPLTAAGKARAERLAEYMKDAGVDAIYSTPTARTRTTGKPLADRLKLQVTETPLQGGLPAFAQNMAAKLREHRNQTVLVVGHSNTLGPLIEALGGPRIAPIADEEYDNIYVVTIGSDGQTNLLRARF